MELVIEIFQETPSESSRAHYFYGLYEHDATIANTAKGETFALIFSTTPDTDKECSLRKEPHSRRCRPVRDS
jgi:hypothetical protein